jgi:hypothetical protein
MEKGQEPHDNRTNSKKLKFTVETCGDGCTITMPTESEHSPITKTVETMPSARITPTKETTAEGKKKVLRRSPTRTGKQFQ